jgi:uncharacterized protein
VNRKLHKIRNILKQQPGVVVAFSGGVDSTLLLKIAVDALQDRVIAVTASSPLHPKQELELAKRLAKKLHSKHVILKSDELKKKNFTSNPRDRCYLCKLALFKKIKKFAARSGYTVIEASNASDLQDYRPGLRALKELRITSPFIEAHVSKREIRMLAKKYKLPNWNRPAMACLATRVPYGRKITKRILQRVESAERYLTRLGLTQVRVRDHEPVARLEIPSKDFKTVIYNRRRITKYFHNLGYTYITLDLGGYQTGSMNR